MKITHQPLLKIQRDLYRIPRGRERFQAYLETMLDARKEDLRLPLAVMNPMGREHVPELLDQYLALDAEGVAAAALTEALPRLAHLPGEVKTALVLADDAQGGWTNRYSAEFSHRFESGPLLKRGWLTGVLWTSEQPSARIVREEILMAIHRAAHIQEHGQARTLREMLAQEGRAMAAAGCAGPALDEAGLEHTRQVVAPCLEAEDRPTVMECLFGDEAAWSLGYSPRDLSLRAGLALALHNAQSPAEARMPVGSRPQPGVLQ